MTLANEPGALAAVAQRLAENHVNISYAYTSGGAPGGKTTCIFKVADLSKAMKLLNKLNGAEKPQARQRARIRPAPSMRR